MPGHGSRRPGAGRGRRTGPPPRRAVVPILRVVAEPSVDDLRRHRDRLEGQDARTRSLCAGRPDLAAVRIALLDVEKTIHRDGWDQPPRMFFVRRHERSGRVSSVSFPLLSREIQARLDRGERPATALAVVAGVTEYMRAVVDGLADPEPADVPVDLRALLGRRPGDDLFDCGAGHRFFGIGFATEAWTTASEGVEASRVNREMAMQGRLDEHPDRIEVRVVYLYPRDGWAWQVTRLRGTRTAAFPRACIAHEPDSEVHVTGRIPEALSRICNAIASDAVPIRHDRSRDLDL